jgi:hypothetical protein
MGVSYPDARAAPLSGRAFYHLHKETRKLSVDNLMRQAGISSAVEHKRVVSVLFRNIITKACCALFFNR